MNINNLRVNLNSKIISSSKVIIVPHERIDYDAFGSAIGLSLITKHLKKVPFIIIDDSISDPKLKLIIDEERDNINFINYNKYESIKSDNDLLILTDVSNKSLIRLNDNNPNNTVIIDHHNIKTDSIISNCSYIVPEASSASEILVNLLKEYNIDYSSKIANYLLAGIYLDTNKLMHNVSSSTLRCVADLIDYGANINYVNNLFQTDFKSDRKIQRLIDNIRYINSNIALLVGNCDEIYAKEELAASADYVLKFEFDAAFAIGYTSYDTVSISARAKDEYDVGSVMLKLNGGGNKYSAATKLNNVNIEDTLSKLVKIIK